MAHHIHDVQGMQDVLRAAHLAGHRPGRACRLSPHTHTRARAHTRSRQSTHACAHLQCRAALQPRGAPSGWSSSRTRGACFTCRTAAWSTPGQELPDGRARKISTVWSGPVVAALRGGIDAERELPTVPVYNVDLQCRSVGILCTCTLRTSGGAVCVHVLFCTLMNDEEYQHSTVQLYSCTSRSPQSVDAEPVNEMREQQRSRDES